MDTAQRAALIRDIRLELKFGIAAQRRSDNFGEAVSVSRRGAFEMNRTIDRRVNGMARSMRRGGLNRHRAAIRGRFGLGYGMTAPGSQARRDGY